MLKFSAKWQIRFANRLLEELPVHSILFNLNENMRIFESRELVLSISQSLVLFIYISTIFFGRNMDE